MKKQLTLLLLLCTGVILAQPTITFSALPVAGTIHSANYDTLGNALWIDSGGINKTWDYSSDFTVHTQSSDTFQDVSLANYSATFPNSNLYLTSGSYEVFYFTSTTGLYLDGETAGSTYSTMDNNPDELIMPVPFTYLNTIKDTSFLSYPNDPMAPFYVTIYLVKTIEADAYGTLTTPDGTFNDVLRLKVTHMEKDSSGTSFTTNISYDNWTEYIWVQNTSDLFLMSITVDSNGIISGGKYNTGLLTSNDEKIVDHYNIISYPNPANKTINWTLKTDKGVIKVFDLKGKEVNRVQVKDRTPKMDISSFSNGLYLYEYYDENGNKTAAGEFIKN